MPKASQQAEEQSRAVSASSSAQQLQDLGFVDVDLDSPDLGLEKTKSDQAPQPSRRQLQPIPFMQTSERSPSSTPSGNADSGSPFGQWPHDRSKGVNQLALPSSPPASPLFQPSIRSSLQTAVAEPALSSSAHQFPPASPPYEHGDPSLSAFAQGPSGVYGAASIHSGPPSIASSAPESPGAIQNGSVPSRRSSFLPRGMSSHLHKALRATAAAASKASAVIAPPPITAQAAQAWQDDVAQLSSASADAHATQSDGSSAEHNHADSSPWGPNIAGTSQLPGKQAPWWQKQLRNLQQNLQSPQSEDESVSEAGSSLAPSIPAVHDQQQPVLLDHTVPYSNGDSLQDLPDDSLGLPTLDNSDQLQPHQAGQMLVKQDDGMSNFQTSDSLAEQAASLQVGQSQQATTENFLNGDVLEEMQQSTAQQDLQVSKSSQERGNDNARFILRVCLLEYRGMPEEQDSTCALIITNRHLCNVL